MKHVLLLLIIRLPFWRERVLRDLVTVSRK